MKTQLALLITLLPLVQAQDSRLLRAVEPRYEKYSEELVDGFDVASASVTMTVMANGKPLSLDRSSVALPMAMVMALKEYEFRPQCAIQHGRPETEAGTYQVTLNVPIRRNKEPVLRDQSAVRLSATAASLLRIEYVPPAYSEFARRNRLEGKIFLEAVITKLGEVGSLKISSGPFVLIEAAYDAVKQWHYKQYLVKGEPVEMLTEIPVLFNLN